MVKASELTAAFWNYDRTQAILDGRVGLRDCRLRCTILRPEDAFRHAFGDASYDVTEISLSNSITALSLRQLAYRLVPVFLSRSFRLGAIFVRADAGIKRPADLAGRIVGVGEYDMTAALVARGILRDAYNVDTHSIRWRVGDKQRKKDLRFPVKPQPPNLDLEVLSADRSLDERLIDGELDALISLRPPAGGDPRAMRLFSDPAGEERAFFRRFGVFPIMHAVGVRRSLADRHPELLREIFDLFATAKRLAVDELEIIQAPKVTLPWVTDNLREARAVLGHDYWPYGIQANRRTLAAVLRWSHEDGLQSRPVAIEELFAGCLDT